MSDLVATTRVTVELTGRPPTIADVQKAIDVLIAEGIPDTFEVSINSATDREYIKDVDYADRPVTYRFRAEAERAAVTK